MTTTIRTPDQITDLEVQRAVYTARHANPSDPAGRALELLRPQTPAEVQFPALFGDVPADPALAAWQGGAEVDALRARIDAALAAHRAWTVPGALTSQAGWSLVDALARRCWRDGVVTWDAVAGLLEADGFQDGARALGYPDALPLAAILPAVDAAWNAIAAEADA